jgi:hypothetical protein
MCERLLCLMASGGAVCWGQVPKVPEMAASAG